MRVKRPTLSERVRATTQLTTDRRRRSPEAVTVTVTSMNHGMPHDRGTGSQPPATLQPRSQPFRSCTPSRPHARTHAPHPAAASASPATCPSTPACIPLACPSTPPRSRWCDGPLNPECLSSFQTRSEAASSLGRFRYSLSESTAVLEPTTTADSNCFSPPAGSHRDPRPIGQEPAFAGFAWAVHCVN